MLSADTHPPEQAIASGSGALHCPLQSVAASVRRRSDAVPLRRVDAARQQDPEQLEAVCPREMTGTFEPLAFSAFFGARQLAHRVDKLTNDLRPSRRARGVRGKSLGS